MASGRRVSGLHYGAFSYRRIGGSDGQGARLAPFWFEHTHLPIGPFLVVMGERAVAKLGMFSFSPLMVGAGGRVEGDNAEFLEPR